MRYVFSILIVAVLLVCVSSCKRADDASQVPTPTAIPATQSNLVVPNVSFVPAGWYLSSDNISLRLLEYRNEVNDDFIRINYGAVPNTLAGNETNGNALMDQAESEAPFTVANKSLTAAGGNLMGCAQAYDVIADLYQIEIVFMRDDTYVEAYAHCRSIHLSEVRELMYSIR